VNTPDLLEVQGISKAFFGVDALKGVTLTVRQGRILGLVGQNGAGKSTLMNVVGGVLQPDAGTMRLAGEPYLPRNTSEATAHGIAFIHQELNLFTNLTVAENVFIDKFPTRKIGPVRLIDRREMRERTRKLLASLDLKTSPDTLVDNLSPGERQLAEIVRALHSDVRLIIFDEPTTSLTARETGQLFATLRRLRASGQTMIYISHILGDVLGLADDVAILRDGELVGEGEATAFDRSRMIALMIGRDLEQLYPTRTRAPSPRPVLEVVGVSQAGVVKDVSFEVGHGEILGVFGLMGSGRTELARILFGLDPTEQGTITMNGVRLKGTAGDSIRNGMAFVTENRREEGLMMESTIADNLAIVALRDFARPPLQVVGQQRLLGEVRSVTSLLQVKGGDVQTQAAKSLSGGNQQKVVIGKWLMSKPRLFIMDEPTRGVDVGAKYEVYTIINDLAAQGNGVIFISSEIEELIGMCDRILVLSHGEIRAAFEEGSFDKASILGAAFEEQEVAA
jgi:ribose transport system ATP-binding protein